LAGRPTSGAHAAEGEGERGWTLNQKSRYDEEGSVAEVTALEWLAVYAQDARGVRT